MNTAPTLWYLYYMLPDRRLVEVRTKRGIKEYTANKELSDGLAAQYSLGPAGYPVTVDTRGDLHNTRDGKVCDNTDFTKNPYLHL